MSQDDTAGTDRHMKSLYRQVIESSLIGVFVHINGKIVYVNEPLLSMSGYSHEEFMNISVFDHVHPDDREFAIEQMKKRVAGNPAEPSYEIRVFKKGGNLIWIKINAVLTEFEGNQAILCNVMDITELLRLKEQKILSERLETSGRIVGRIAHEMGNFLSPILGYTELLLSKYAGDEETTKYLRSMELCGNRLSEINSDILALGRRLNFNVDLLDLNQIIKEVVQEVEITAEKSVSVETEYCDDVYEIMGDRRQLVRVFINILNNSYESVPEKDGRITISVCNTAVNDTIKSIDTIPKGDYATVTVCDNGTGIPGGVREEIFKPFFTTKKPEERRGSGLGLSVVRGVSFDHEALIELNTSPDKGTMFRIYFPPAPDFHGETKTAD